METFGGGTRTARKPHDDTSKEWIEDMGIYSGSILPGDLTFSELRAIVEARKRRWKILPGMQYEWWVWEDEGQIGTYKTLPIFTSICRRLGLWDE